MLPKADFDFRSPEIEICESKWSLLGYLVRGILMLGVAGLMIYQRLTGVFADLVFGFIVLTSGFILIGSIYGLIVPKVVLYINERSFKFGAQEMEWHEVKEALIVESTRQTFLRIFPKDVEGFLSSRKSE